MVSQPEVQLEQCLALLRRLAELERAYRPYLRSGLYLDQEAGRFHSSVSRACEAFLSGRSQAERLVLRSPVKPSHSSP